MPSTSIPTHGDAIHGVSPGEGHEMHAATSVGGRMAHDGHSGDSGHDKHAGHDPEMFRRRFWLSLLLTVPVVVTSGVVMDWFGYHLGGVAWVGPVVGTFV